MKKLIIITLLLSSFSPFVLATEYPFGLENDPTPGQCEHYTDQNQNWYCDLSQDLDLETYNEEGEVHDCDDVVEWEISGSELKSKTVEEVALLYAVPTDQVVAILKQNLKTDITPQTSIQTLHDEHGLRIATIKNLMEPISPLSLILTTKTNPIQKVVKYFYSMRLMAFGALIILLIMLFVIHKRFPKFVKYFLNISCYIFIPLMLLWRVLYIALILQEWHGVFAIWRWLGYWWLRLLFLILLVKPLSLHLTRTKNKVSIAIQRWASRVMRRRRQLGVLVFYLIFTHFLVYIVFWFTRELAFFDFFHVFAVLTGLVGLLTLLVAYLTSNNRSIKYFKKNRKKLQMLSYLWLIFGVIHISIINIQVGYVLIPVTILYLIIKVLEWRKLLLKKWNKISKAKCEK